MALKDDMENGERDNVEDKNSSEFAASESLQDARPQQAQKSLPSQHPRTMQQRDALQTLLRLAVAHSFTKVTPPKKLDAFS